MLEPSTNELVGLYIKELLAPVDIANKGEYGGNLFSDHRMTSTCSSIEGEFQHTMNRGPVQKAARREKWIKGSDVRIETKHVTITTSWLRGIID
ncbi:hypothetical protein OWV82_011954 [Melia azedarach]|uniref:Uncharacterized protein n=1 Tax=Melia azedarach TaxID=155640 RepID=A0ACC1Y1D8_MELAZ|nr:hypothetical protein OWV82_011954 [Melia azedarach]